MAHNLVLCRRCRQLLDKCWCPEIYLIAFEPPNVDAANAASGNTAPEWFNRLLAYVGTSRGFTSNGPLPSWPMIQNHDEESRLFFDDLLSDRYANIYTSFMIISTNVKCHNKHYEGLREEGVYYPPMPAGYNSPLYINMEICWSKAGDISVLSYRISGMASTRSGLTVDTTIIRAMSFAEESDANRFATHVGIPRLVFPRSSKAISTGSWIHLASIGVEQGVDGIVDDDGIVDVDAVNLSTHSANANREMLSAKLGSEIPVVPGPTPADEDHMGTLYVQALALHEHLKNMEGFRGRVWYPSQQIRFNLPFLVAVKVRRLLNTSEIIPLTPSFSARSRYE